MPHVTERNIGLLALKHTELLKKFSALSHTDCFFINTLSCNPRRFVTTIQEILRRVAIHYDELVPQSIDRTGFTKFLVARSFFIEPNLHNTVKVSLKSSITENTYAFSYDIYTGTLTGFALSSEYKAPLATTSDSNPAQNGAKTFPYSPETFLSFCHLKNLSHIDYAIILEGVTLNELPPHHSFPNIITIENDATSIAIL